MSREFGMRGPSDRAPPHDEFEMRDVVFLLRIDHQEFVLVARGAVQTVAAVEHVDLERGDAVFDQMLHLLDLRGSIGAT